MNDQMHDSLWDDRLQAWFDDDLDEHERVLTQTHLQSCVNCQEKLSLMRALDATLSQSIPFAALDPSFDARILERIDADTEALRLQARSLAQVELQAQFEALKRNWRRRLLAMLPGVLAGIAFALALTLYFDTAEWLRALVANTSGEIAGVSSGFIHLLLTSSLGAAIGYGIAAWLSEEHT